MAFAIDGELSRAGTRGAKEHRAGTSGPSPVARGVQHSSPSGTEAAVEPCHVAVLNGNASTSTRATVGTPGACRHIASQCRDRAVTLQNGRLDHDRATSPPAGRSVSRCFGRGFPRHIHHALDDQLPGTQDDESSAVPGTWTGAGRRDRVASGSWVRRVREISVPGDTLATARGVASLAAVTPAGGRSACRHARRTLSPRGVISRTVSAHEPFTEQIHRTRLVDLHQTRNLDDERPVDPEGRLGNGQVAVLQE